MTTEVINGATRDFGPRLTEKQRPGATLTFGETKEIVIDFDYANLPTASSNDAVVLQVPAYAYFVSAVLQVGTTWAGGTSIEVGTEQPDGTDVDVDGLITPAQGAVANLVAGYVISGRGAQIVEAPDAAGTAHVDGDGVYAAGANGPVATVASQVTVRAVGTFTAGTAKLIVRYVERS